MSEHVSRKRARTSLSNSDSDSQDTTLLSPDQCSESTQQRPRTRDQQFWYNDGNIILIAGDVEFRVYRGLLAENSPVFADMFTLPQPAVANALEATAPDNDSCPSVHLSDSPHDLRHILRVYMPRRNQSPYLLGDLSFDMVSAAVRLGHKYQMDALVKQSLDYLKRYYADLTSWNTHRYNHPPGFKNIHSIGVINIARLTGETSLLPTALFACCQLNQEIIDGLEREDGTRERLALDDIGLCLLAKTKLVQESVRLSLHILRPLVSEQCKTHAECNRAFRVYARRIESATNAIARSNPFFVLLYLDTAIDQPNDLQTLLMCSSCKTMVEERRISQRAGLWAKITQILGVSTPEPVGTPAGGAAVAAA